MSQRVHDVVIVGGGPAGSAAAIVLARAHWDVLLIDKAAFPRDKTCGDFLSPRSLRVLDRLGCRPALEAAGPNRLDGASLYLGGRPITAGNIPKVGDLADYGYTLPRFAFDEIVYRQAQAAGAQTVEHCEVTGLALGNDCVTLQVRGQQCALRARLVIAADGAHSAIARALGMASRSSKNIVMALRAYFDGVEGDPTRAEIFFDEGHFPGYAWLFPVGGSRANVGLGMVMDVYQRYHINLRERLTDWLVNDPVAKARLGRAQLTGRITGWPLNTYTARGSRYAERVLFAGDAGSFVDPINGEGIHTALESACMAATVADEALRFDDCSAAFLARYEEQWRAAFDLDLRTADLIVTIIENRSLLSIWLLILKMIGERAMDDRAYAAVCGGILAGVMPTQQALTPSIILKTLQQDPAFWARNLPGGSNLSGWRLVDLGLLAVRDLVDAAQREPGEMVSWGADVAQKGAGVLAGLAEGYSAYLPPLIQEFSDVWAAQARRRRRRR